MKIMSDAEAAGWKIAVFVLAVSLVFLLFKKVKYNKVDFIPTDTLVMYEDTLYVNDTIYDTVSYFYTKTLHDTIFLGEM